jgi:acetyltransferase-like isoleucine patch superfamily enzyme
VKRADTPFYAGLKRIAKAILTFHIPVPGLVKPFFRLLYGLHFAIIGSFRRIRVLFYAEPLFRSRCESVGKSLSLERLPYVAGHPRIVIGDNVRLSGWIGFASGHILDHPEVIIGNRVFLGDGVTLKANRQIVIEDDVLISQGCYIGDSDDHPIDLEARIAGRPSAAEEIRPVRIARGAWIGRRSLILKGVTIGEGAIVGAASIVTKDVPPFSIAAGNPARVIRSLRGE